MRIAIGLALSFAALWFMTSAPARKLVAGRRYRATFDVPEGAAGHLASLQSIMPTGSLVSFNKLGQLVVAFVAPTSGDLDDPSTPMAGDVQTPLGPLVLRRLEEIT